MSHFRRCILLLFALSLPALAAIPTAPQRTVPSMGIPIPPDDRARLQRDAARLAEEIESLRTRANSDARVRELLPDVEIFHKAVDWALRYDEFFRSNEVGQADHLLRLGSDRAKQLAAGHPAWLTSTGLVVRGYRSSIDGSVQPYGLIVPSTYASDTNRPRRLDVWLHGRDDKLTELKFISDRLRSYGEFTPQDTLVLHPYGRFCNAFKFAGETDVFEAMAHAQRFYPVNTNRLAIRGFSMGGAGTWHLAAHHPETWAAAAPGAGFAETAEYTGALAKNPKPPWYEQKLWHLYDATDYALNLFNVPTIAYSGEIDKQKQAADIMAHAMQTDGMELQHVIGPGVAHKYEPGAKKELARRFDDIMARDREPFPTHIRFATWTLAYHQAGWLHVLGLQRHWEKATVDAEWTNSRSLRITTTNVQTLRIDFPNSIPSTENIHVILDGDEFRVPAHLPPGQSGNAGSFKRMGGSVWVAIFKDLPPFKKPGLHGPIDDAFMHSFLVVRPTQAPMNAGLAAWVDGELARFTNEWRAQFRGEPQILDSHLDEVRRASQAGANILLWGDPLSNPVLAALLPKLPLQWDAKEIRFGTNRFDATTHVPVFIFPNPLNPTRYLVINSGPTFFDFGAASNAQQTPKLPDYAVLDITVPRAEKLTRGVALAGFFDENWKLPDASAPR